MEEVAGFSLDASHEDTSGYRRNNHFRQTNLAGTLEAHGDRARAYLRFAAADQSLGLPGQLTEAQILADPRQASTPGNKSDRQDGTLTLGGAWNAGRHDLAADLSYRNKNASAVFLPAFVSDTNVNVWSFVPRARLRFDALGREHDVTLGMDWERWDYDNRTPSDHHTGEQTNHAFYAQANLWAAERTRFVLGGRGQRREERPTLLFPPGERPATHTLEAYEAALRQGFGAGWAGYAQYGTSLRLAHFDANARFAPR